MLVEKTEAQGQNGSLCHRGQQSKYLFVASDGQFHKVMMESILCFASEGNYVHIHTKDKVHFVRASLSKLMPLLPACRFAQIHKSFIVQIDAIDIIDRSNSEVQINNILIPIGRSYKAGLLGGLNFIG